MATWTLSDIRNKVRQVSGRLSSSEMTNQQIDKYINQFYQFTFPADAKLNKNLVYYSFVTSPNESLYPFPTGYTNFLPPVVVNYLQTDFYQDPALFFSRNPIQVTQLTPWTGDGTTVLFTTTVQAFPIYPGSVIISDNVETFADNTVFWTTSNINITGSEGGTAVINLSTGAISVTFNTAPPNGQNIYLTYVLFQPGRPVSMLMYDSRFQFYPPPDTAYKVVMGAYKVVDALVNATDTPALEEWGPAIAYGACRDIFADYGETDSFSDAEALYRQQLAYILRRTEQDLLSTRADPQF